MIAKPPKRRTITRRFFFSRAQRNLGRCGDLFHVVRCLGPFARLGQEARHVQVGLVSRLLVDFEFDGGEAGGVAHQAFEPLILAFDQQSSRLFRNRGGV